MATSQERERTINEFRIMSTTSFLIELERVVSQDISQFGYKQTNADKRAFIDRMMELFEAYLKRNANSIAHRILANSTDDNAADTITGQVLNEIKNIVYTQYTQEIIRKYSLLSHFDKVIRSFDDNTNDPNAFHQTKESVMMTLNSAIAYETKNYIFYLQRKNNLAEDAKIIILKRLLDRLSNKADTHENKLKTFAREYKAALPMLTVGADSVGISFLKAIGHILATVITLGLYAPISAAVSYSNRGSARFWDSDQTILRRNIKKTIPESIYNSPKPGD